MIGAYRLLLLELYNDQVGVYEVQNKCILGYGKLSKSVGVGFVVNNLAWKATQDDVDDGEICDTYVRRMLLMLGVALPPEVHTTRHLPSPSLPSALRANP